jgi:hypothetical protein
MLATTAKPPAVPRSCHPVLDRVGALAGIAHALLVPIGFSVFAAGTSEFVDLTSTRAEIAAEFARPARTVIWVGGFIEVCAFLLFLLFAARLWAELRAAEGAPGWLSATVLISASTLVGVGLVSFTVGAATYMQAGHLDTNVAVALTDVRSFAFHLNAGVAALFLTAVAGVGLAYRALPRTLGWTAAALAPLLVSAMALPRSDFSQTPPLLMLLWVLAVSVTLLRRPGSTS